MTCPFHRGDTTPSLQLYADGSWYCFGCQRGGTIYDFAAALWGTGTKHREFIALRDRLAEELGLSSR
ncbi:MAG: CHC2 zinc finger domain-containing protein [Solirubrobacteraceae bacterium]